MQKYRLLEILSSTECPICGQEKRAHNWTCVRCGTPHQRTTELRALSDACDAHMATADVFLEMARAAYQKPESD